MCLRTAHRNQFSKFPHIKWPVEVVNDGTAEIMCRLRIPAVTQLPRLSPPLALFNAQVEVRRSDEKGPLDSPQNNTFVNQVLQFAIDLDMANRLVAY